MANTETVGTWLGRPIETLAREELIEVVSHLVRQVQTLQSERSAMWPHVNMLGYLKAKGPRHA